MSMYTASGTQSPFPSVGALITFGETILPTMTVNDVADRFFTSRELQSLALVADGKVYGLATRAKSFAILFRRFGFELFGKDPIIDIADRNPLVVEEGESLDVTLERAMARPHQDIYDEVVVVGGTGRFKGLLSVKQMVVAQSRALALCATERDRARSGLREMGERRAVNDGRIARLAGELDQRLAGIAGALRLTSQALGKGQLQWVVEEVALLSATIVSLQERTGAILDLSGRATELPEVYEFTPAAGTLPARDIVDRA
jgi:hypothetical protein